MTQINFPHQKLFDSAILHLEEIIDISIWKVVTESPIEKEFLKAIYLFSLLTYGEMPRPEFEGKTTITVKTQVEIDDFRVDFLITSLVCKKRFIVECDGHDFHERTKEQAKKDKSRDRYLTAKGYTVLRFTGSEIWNNPWGCAEEIDNQIYSSSYLDHSSNAEKSLS